MRIPMRATTAAILFVVGVLARADDALTTGTTQLPKITVKETTDESYATPQASAATKTDTPLIDIPQSVQVINQRLLGDQDVRTLAQALVNVSGVVPTMPEDLLFTPPIVRGFPAEVYVDCLPILGGNQQAFDATSLVGVKQIEVLEGPNSCA